MTLSAPTSINACLSDVAEASIMLDGKNFRLDFWPMHRAFYDGRFGRTLFKTSRQVAKSTTLANFSIIECTLIPHFSTMFVSPSKEQTVRFSTTRVQKTMRYSPRMTRFLDPDLSDRVFHKQFTNGAEMLFTYALDEAERLRGPSTDRNMYDEVQDMLYDPVITVGNETLNESDHMFETYAGTPKTMENTIEFLWSLSTQTEWVMKCDSCGSYQFIDSERSIGKEGPICVKCKSYLNPFTGQWIDLNAKKLDEGDLDTQLKGFHISQLMMPSNCPIAMAPFGEELVLRARHRWARIRTKFEELPAATFRNEVLGVSDAQGTRLITLEELQELCTGPAISDVPTPANMKNITQTVAGIDWSGGGVQGLSSTVLWIWGWNAAIQKLSCLHYKVYSGLNPVDAVRSIAQTCAAYRVVMAVGDAGEGALANDELRKALGHHRVSQVQYGAQKQQLMWNGVDRYTADRTTLIDNYFMLLKRQGVLFGPPEYMKRAIDEILNEYEEITTIGRKVWRHSPQKPDDCLHAGLFGWVAWRLMNGDT